MKLEKALEALKVRKQEDLSIRETARRFYVTRSTLHRRFIELATKAVNEDRLSIREAAAKFTVAQSSIKIALTGGEGKISTKNELHDDFYEPREPFRITTVAEMNRFFSLWTMEEENKEFYGSFENNESEAGLYFSSDSSEDEPDSDPEDLVRIRQRANASAGSGGESPSAGSGSAAAAGPLQYSSKDELRQLLQRQNAACSQKCLENFRERDVLPVVDHFRRSTTQVSRKQLIVGLLLAGALDIGDDYGNTRNRNYIRTSFHYIIKRRKLCQPCFLFLVNCSKHLINSTADLMKVPVLDVDDTFDEEHATESATNNNAGDLLSTERRTREYTTVVPAFITSDITGQRANGYSRRGQIMAAFFKRFADRYAYPARTQRNRHYLRSGVVTNETILYLLPPFTQKKAVYKAFIKELDFPDTTTEYSYFLKQWSDRFMHIGSMRSPSDACSMCRQFEHQMDECTEAITFENVHSSWKVHRQLALIEREHYKNQLLLTQQALHEYLSSGQALMEGAAGVNSVEFAVHCSFDFATTVTLPSFAKQPEKLYLKSGLKVRIFAVACETVNKQINYIIPEGCFPVDESQSRSGKGANCILSMLLHHSCTYSYGERRQFLHADASAGYAKNEYMLYFLLWKVFCRRNDHIQLSFMVPGHTKFAPDVGFGLLKHALFGVDVRHSVDLENVINASSTFNACHNVQTNPIPYYDWKKFLVTKFKANHLVNDLRRAMVIDILRNASDDVTIIFRSSSNDEGKQISATDCLVDGVDIHSFHPNLPHELSTAPYRLSATQMSTERQQYLLSVADEFISETFGVEPRQNDGNRDVVCEAGTNDKLCYLNMKSEEEYNALKLNVLLEAKKQDELKQKRKEEERRSKGRDMAERKAKAMEARERKKEEKKRLRKEQKSRNQASKKAKKTTTTLQI